MPGAYSSAYSSAYDIGVGGYTITADAGTFALSGQAAGLLAGRSIGAGQGAFVLTGQDAGLDVTRSLVASVGTFTLSGQDAALSRGRTIVAATGEFALSGQAAGLEVDRLISAAVGSFVLTGQDAELTSSGELEPAECGTNLTIGAEAWLASMLQAHASHPVIYRRGNDEIALCATFDRTLLKLTDELGGVKVERTDRDFIIPVASLVIDGTPILPKRDDEIIHDDGVNVHTFKALPYGPDEPQWTWHGMHRKMVRVRTKRISTEPA
jgi:hypothetical protein